jgi:hypothetical protein
MHPVRKGDLTALRVTVALMASGETVLRPVSENCRYDLALDRGGALFRIQCKTGRMRKGSVVFNTCSNSMSTGGIRRDYAGQIEAFGVECEGKVYLVPVDAVRGRTEQALRVEPRKKGVSALVASQFEI